MNPQLLNPEIVPNKKEPPCIYELQLAVRYLQELAAEPPVLPPREYEVTFQVAGVQTTVAISAFDLPEFLKKVMDAQGHVTSVKGL